MNLITNSRSQAFLACRRRHHYSYGIGIKQVLDGAAIRKGHAFHAGMEVFATTADLDAATSAAIDAYPSCPENYNPQWYEIEKQTVAVMVAGWVWRWSGMYYEVVATEQSFTVHLPGMDDGWMLAGKIDNIVRLEDGRLAVREFKTVSEDIAAGARYWNRLVIDPQPTLYLMAARILGYDVETVIWDAARKPTAEVTDIADLDDDGLKIINDANGNRVRTKTGTWRQTASAKDGYVTKTHKATPEEWAGVLIGMIEEEPDYYYARRELPRLDHEIEETRSDIIAVQKQMAAAQLDPALNYRTAAWNTCPYCPYMTLCGAGWDQTMGLPAELEFSDNIHPELNFVVPD